MTGRHVSRVIVLVVISLTLFNQNIFIAHGGAGEKGTLPQPASILLEARITASTLEEQQERSSALDAVLRSQIDLDPAGAQDSLKLISNLSNRWGYFASLAAVYAKAGNVDQTERMYAEILIEGRASPQGKLAADVARGDLAVAYANAGQLEESLRIVSQMKDQSRERPPAILGTAMARIAEVQAKQGDLPGAVRTATVIAHEDEDPSALMSIVGGRARAGDLPGALKIVSGLDKGLQPYAQWGIVRAQKDQGRLTEAQLTASTIKPGHAKASALLELATHHLKVGAKSVAEGLLQEAATAAASTVNDLARADVLWRIAATMAEGGETLAAIETARSIEKNAHRRFAIHDIVKAQAKQGDIKGAFNNALLLKQDQDTEAGSPSYELAVSDILAEWSKAGRAREARESVENFDEFKERQELLYARIAAAQADVGDIQGAKTTLLLAETPVQRAARNEDRSRLAKIPKEYLNEVETKRLDEINHMRVLVNWTFEGMAKAQCRKGNLREALATSRELSNDSTRSRLIQELGAIQVHAGRTQEALTWARALPSPSNKTYALLGIAQGLAAQKTKPTAKNSQRDGMKHVPALR